MKIVFAPDKFKGCMRSPQVCELLSRAFGEVLPDAELVSTPMADGGEGTVDAIVAARGGKLKSVRVCGPLGACVDARFGLYNKSRSAVMEMSSASGMELLGSLGLDPMKASSFGTGELLKAALDCEPEEIVVGIGGSATVDGGAGMAQALGYKLLDEKGEEIGAGGAELSRLASISAEGVDKRIFKTKLRVACDVNNPLLGRNGAAFVYGPQKGATPSMVAILDKGLANLARVWKESGMLSSTDAHGDGAAGGLGAGMKAFCKASLESGAKLVIEAVDLERHLEGASLVIVGEGRSDSQSFCGKACVEVARLAKARGIPSLLLSGCLNGDLIKMNETFDVALSISTGHSSLDEAIAAGRHDLYFTAKNLASLVKLRLLK